MNKIIHKQNLLYLLFVRGCYNLRFWMRSMYLEKLLKAITIQENDMTMTKWYIKPYDKLILHKIGAPACVLTSHNKIYKYWYIYGKYHSMAFDYIS